MNIKEIKKAEKRITQFPEAFPLIGLEIRKCTIRKFPYNLRRSPSAQEAILLG